MEERELSLLRRIKRDEMGNFGGIEWRWGGGPQNGGLGELIGIVYFVRDAEKTLVRYTNSPFYKAAQADFATFDQETVVRQWAERIGRDVATEGFANIQVPWLDIALPRAGFEERVRSKRWRLPSNLKLRLNPRAEPDLPAVSAPKPSSVASQLVGALRLPYLVRMSRTDYLALLLLAGLPGCQATQTPASPPESKDGMQGGALKASTASGALVTLVGRWRVTEINGRLIDPARQLELVADANKIWWEPGCAGMVRKYSITAQLVQFSPINPPVKPGAPPQPVCAIGLPPGLDDIFRVLDATKTTVPGAGGEVRIEGGGQYLTMVRR
jgi:hypothetical protein